MKIHQAVGTSLAVIVVTALAGGFRHYLAGHVDMKVVVIVGIVAVLGALMGAQLTTYLSGVWLKRIFAVCLIAISVRMLIQG